MDFQFIGICFATFTVLGFLIASSIAIYKSKKTQVVVDDKDIRMKTDINYQFEETEHLATVIDMSCSTRVVGIKDVKSIEEFFITFETESGEILKLQVFKGMYDGFEIGLKGKLQLVEGELFSFEPLNKE